MKEKLPWLLAAILGLSNAGTGAWLNGEITISRNKDGAIQVYGQVIQEKINECQT